MGDELDIFREIFDVAGVGIFQTSPEGRFMCANQTLADMNGYSDPESLLAGIGNVATDVYVDPSTRARFLDLIARQGKVNNFVVRYRRRDGSLRWASETATPVHDAAGRLLYFIGTSIDITELVRLQEALEETSGNYRDIYENANIGIYRSSPEGRQLRANPALFRLNGYENEAEQLAMVNDIATEWYVDPDRREEFKRLMERDGRVSGFESEIYTHRTRRRIWISENAWVARNAQGEVLYYEGTVQDITERKLAEKAVEEARRAAEDSSRAKSEFLANMSHELRTPLNAVIGFSDIMLREMFGAIGNERYRGYLRDINESAHLLLHLIEDILDMSRSEAGKLVLQEEVVDLGDIVADCVRLITVRAERETIQIIDDTAYSQARLLCDGARMRQIVLNLLSNAVKFTAPGGRIQVSIGEAHDGGLQLCVADTGCGIAPEDLARAFEPFVQLGRQPGTREGTGLGLPLTRQLVEAHGGTVELESEPGVGTTAIVRLPRNRMVL
jgi:PAS domain S-box-containing protein